MNYLALHCSVEPAVPFVDLLSYYLAEAGFSMFENEDDKLIAWMPENEYDEARVSEAISRCEEAGCKISYEWKQVAQQNWNEEWEKSYLPEIVDEQIYIFADFHPRNLQYPYSLHIQPQMSFGTGHHPTTRMMLRHMLAQSFGGTSVLDMGCGTAILAIFARMKGAVEVTAVEILPDAVANAAENCLRNQFNDIRVLEGSEVPEGKYDFILANINRSILIDQFASYAQYLNRGGKVIVSGFYEDDLPLVQKAAESQGLRLSSSSARSNGRPQYFKNDYA